VGLAGKPEHPEAFVRFAVDQDGESGKTEIYLAREIWEGIQPKVDRLEVLLPGYGTFGLCFEGAARDRRA
jgi:hypothetical protein